MYVHISEKSNFTESMCNNSKLWINKYLIEISAYNCVNYSKPIKYEKSWRIIPK